MRDSPDPSDGLDARATTIADALARNDRFIAEAIEGLRICPFASSARLSGASTRYVDVDVCGETIELNPTQTIRAAFEELRAAGAVEVTQVIFPLVRCPPAAWVHAVKALTAVLHAELGCSVVGSAAFHPDLPYRIRTPATMVPLFRRAPDPTLQWIRLDILERVRAGRPCGDVPLPRDAAEFAELRRVSSRKSVDAEISEANWALAARLGVDALEQLFASMRSAPSTGE